MSDRLVLHEYETAPEIELTNEDLKLISTLPVGRIQVLAGSDQGRYRIRSQSWVGTVHLSSRELRILPKVRDLENLLLMLRGAAGLADWAPRTAPFTSTSWVDGVAELVLNTIDLATRRGLLHGYRTQEERTPVLRGRLQIATLAARPWDEWPLPCRYEEFTADIAENQVLLATVSLLRRFVMDAVLRRNVISLTDRFAEVTTPTAPLALLDSIAPTSLNAHYQPALRLARLVIEGLGVSHQVGDIAGASFLIDMNRLYELWLSTELSLRLGPDLQVIEQFTTWLDVDRRIQLRPDLVIRGGRRNLLVGDVKYKLTGTGRARNPDYYQLHAYTTALGLSQGVLIYCQADDAPPRRTVIRGHEGEKTLTCFPLPLSGTRQDVEASLNTLAVTLRGQAQVGLATFAGRARIS